MQEQTLSRLRIGFTALVTLATLAHLAWQHFDGGVVSHHLLHRADMPSISNWWSALLLPLLSWYLAGRAQRRIQSHVQGHARKAEAAKVIVGFACSVAVGALLSISFVLGYESITPYVLLSTALLAVLLPAYRAECFLGFVLGMAFMFGAVLPAIIGSLILALSAAVHIVFLPRAGQAWRRVTGRKSSTI